MMRLDQYPMAHISAVLMADDGTPGPWVLTTESGESITAIMDYLERNARKWEEIWQRHPEHRTLWLSFTDRLKAQGVTLEDCERYSREHGPETENVSDFQASLLNLSRDEFEEVGAQLNRSIEYHAQMMTIMQIGAEAKGGPVDLAYLRQSANGTLADTLQTFQEARKRSLRIIPPMPGAS